MIDLQKTVGELTEERIDTTGSVADCEEAPRDLISPVRRLALDMLKEIFVACLRLAPHRSMDDVIGMGVEILFIAASWEAVDAGAQDNHGAA
jgi:hypothetical protein